MNAIYDLTYPIIILFALFKTGQSIYHQIIWRRERRSQNAAAAAFKSNNEPTWQLVDKNITSLARVLRRESLNEHGIKKILHKEDIEPQVYRVFDYNIAEKKWLSSNSAFSVSNTLNGFEFFIPGVARRWLHSSKPESIDIVFYKNVAIFAGCVNEFDLFEEKQTHILSVPDLQARQTAIETFYEAPAHCAEFDVLPCNGGRLVRAIKGETMVLFKDENLANGHMFVIGMAGFLSMSCALIASATMAELSQNHFLSQLSYFESVLILSSVFWIASVSLFNIYQRFRFRYKAIIIADRKTSKVYIKKSGKFGLKAVPWEELMVRVSSQMGYLVGTSFTTLDNKLEFFAANDPRHTNAGFCAGSLSGGLGVWKALYMFMNGQLDSTLEITPSEAEYQKGDPQKDGLYLLRRRIKTTFLALPLTAKVLHFFLFLITLGPLPYIIADRLADTRVNQAFKLSAHS